MESKFLKLLEDYTEQFKANPNSKTETVVTILPNMVLPKEGDIAYIEYTNPNSMGEQDKSASYAGQYKITKITKTQIEIEPAFDTYGSHDIESPKDDKTNYTELNKPVTRVILISDIDKIDFNNKTPVILASNKDLK